jgi:hypothetical protein
LQAFQFFLDDANQATATAIAGENVNITRDRALNTRCRMQTDVTGGGDPPSQTRTILYKESGDPDSELRTVLLP